MPLSLKILKRASGRKILVGERDLDDDLITVGRGQNCTVVLEDPNRYLSRVQGEFERKPRGYVLRVMSGTSPILVNDVAYHQGSEVELNAGDTLVMEGYDLKVLSASAAKFAPVAAPAAKPAPAPAPGPVQPRAREPVQVTVHSDGSRQPRPKWLVPGVAATAAVILLALAIPAIKGLLPDPAEQRRAEQQVARLEGEAKSLLRLVEGDWGEVKDSTAMSNRELERAEGLVRSTRSSQERYALEAAVSEARRMARASLALESKVRERIQSPTGLPRAEGALSAAATAARGGERAEAIRLLEETVVALTQMRAKIAEDRKATQAELDKRREDMLSAEYRAMAEAEARGRVEAETKARARARLEADAVRAVEGEQGAHPAPVAASACLARLAGTWTHPAGGTWTFAGNQGTRTADSARNGAKARQVTTMTVTACDAETMTYRIARLALVNTDNPAQAYDRTEATAPDLPVWAKANTLRYSLSAAGLRIGNYTYEKR